MNCCIIFIFVYFYKSNFVTVPKAKWSDKRQFRPYPAKLKPWSIRGSVISIRRSVSLFSNSEAGRLLGETEDSVGWYDSIATLAIILRLFTAKMGCSSKVCAATSCSGGGANQIRYKLWNVEVAFKIWQLSKLQLLKFSEPHLSINWFQWLWLMNEWILKPASGWCGKSSRR